VHLVFRMSRALYLLQFVAYQQAAGLVPVDADRDQQALVAATAAAVVVTARPYKVPPQLFRTQQRRSRAHAAH
jgi:hypothetical protein